MYAQCPACLTTFKVTPAQLTARGGMVRCGICSAIFHAKQRLLQVSPTPGAEATAPPREETVAAKKYQTHAWREKPEGKFQASPHQN